MTIEHIGAARTIEIIDAAKARKPGEKSPIEVKIAAILCYTQVRDYFTPATKNPLEALELIMKEQQLFNTLIACLDPELVKNPEFESALKTVKASMMADLNDIRARRKARGQ